MEKAIILENDSKPDDIISAFATEFEPHFDIDVITNISHRDPASFIEQFNEADAYFISTTFENKEQNQFFIELFKQQTRPKEIFINYLSDRLYIALNDIIKEKPEWKHKIFEIEHSSKIASSGKYFKKINYYFDTIPYYWSDQHSCYFPERPTCIIDNLKEIYKYTPEWITK